MALRLYPSYLQYSLENQLFLFLKAARRINVGVTSNFYPKPNTFIWLSFQSLTKIFQADRPHQEHSQLHPREHRGSHPGRGWPTSGRMLSRADQGGRPVVFADQTDDALLGHGEIKNYQSWGRCCGTAVLWRLSELEVTCLSPAGSFTTPWQWL